ncbi:MAG: hypothetical protein AAGJ79_15640, partial [Verrucomicrobiota bacterium]
HKEPEDFRSDIYSLGATLFHAAAGRPPYDAKSSSLEELKAIKDKPVSVAEAAPELSKGAIQLIDRMMSREPSDRHDSYDALLEDLRFLQEQGTHGLPTVRNARFKVGAGVAATLLLLGVVVGLSMLGGKSDEGKTAGQSVPVAEEGAIKATEGKTLAQRFVDARRALVGGKTKVAAEAFRAIATDTETMQPTLNWSRFNLGLSQMLEGKMEASNRWFALLAEEVEANSEAEAEEAILFLAALGRRMNDPLPVLMEEKSEFESSVFRRIAWLAFGLKNWQQGEFDESGRFLEVFAKEKPDLTERWISEYRPLLRPYTEDLKTLKKGPPVAQTIVLEEARGWLKQIESMQGQLKTPGAAPAYLANRKERLEALVVYLEDEADSKEKARFVALLEEERKELSELRESLGKLRGVAKIQEAIELIDSVEFEHPKVREEFGRITFVWRESDKFLDQIIKDLDEHGYEGSLLRTSGGDADVVVVGASREGGVSFAFRDLGAGESVIRIDEIAPRTLVEMAEAMSMKDPEMEEYLKRRKYLALFAYHVGEVEAALDAVEELKSYDKEFVQGWRDLVQANPAESSNSG